MNGKKLGGDNMVNNRFLYTNLLELPNCAGLSDTGKCFWLSINSCQGYSCPFKKTRETQENSIKAVENRLSELDEENQERIARKYYGGKRPWLQSDIKPNTKD